MRRTALLLALAGLLGGCRQPEIEPHRQIPGSDPARGRAVVERTACGVCHNIPSIAGARGRLGPPLGGFGTRALIAGVVPNRPDVLARFVREAPSVVKDTAMPPMPLSQREALDVAAFLYTLR